MAKEILDIYVEQGYAYELTLDMDDSFGEDIEDAYDCFFYNEYVGEKQFSNVSGEYYFLEIIKEDTGKIIKNLSEYSVYTIKKSDSKKEKMLSGRIILDKKVS